MLQELLSMEIAPIGSTHYDDCRPSSMSASIVAAIRSRGLRHPVERPLQVREHS
jgi:hypothetical protein